MEALRYDISQSEKDRSIESKVKEAKTVKVGRYLCEETKTSGIYKIKDRDNDYVVRCYCGIEERYDKDTGVKKSVPKNTLRVAHSYSEAKEILAKANQERAMRRAGEMIPSQYMTTKVTIASVIEDFKHDKKYLNLDDNYRKHYDNYFKHFMDFMGTKEPRKISVADIEDYYDYQLHRGNLSTAKRNKDGSVSKKYISKDNPEGISVNTISKHKTALKNLWKFMLRKQCYGVEQNVVRYSELPKVSIEIDGKEIMVSYIEPEHNPLTLEELNYTLNDAIQNEADRSLVLMIALASIGGLRRGEIAALKVGRYYHNELMMLGTDMWRLNDFKDIKGYYESHNELIMIDEAIRIGDKEKLGFPKYNIIRMCGKPSCLDRIVEYCMEQRLQVMDTLGVELTGTDRLYMPLRNVLRNESYSAAKVTRKWMEYQERRNKRMEKAGLEPIKIVRLHDLRHTHATLLAEEVAEKKISKNMGHKIKGEGQLINTTTKVYIHDRNPERESIIEFWDKHIVIDWEKALRIDINDPANRAHVNGSGHLVLKNEEMERIKNLKGRPWLSEEEEAELLCSKYKDVE